MWILACSPLLAPKYPQQSGTISFSSKVLEGVYVRTVILLKAGKELYKMKTHHKLKSLNFIYHNTICLDVYKVIHIIHMFPKELTHIP